jgi:hypothetical protein
LDAKKNLLTFEKFALREREREREGERFVFGFGAMAGQVVTSLVSSRGATTSCVVVVAAHKLKASSSSSYSTSCSLPLTMVTTGFELGPKDRRRWRSMGGGSLSLRTEPEFRDKKNNNNNKSMCHAVRPLSETEAAEGNVTIFEDCE